jgi:UDP-N-acetylmuramate dehydrogenase
MIRNFIKENNLEYLENVSLKKYNTYRLDVKANYMVFPRNIEELVLLVKYLKDNKIKHLVLGNGSNVIFKGDIYDGVIIKLSKFNYKEVNNNVFRIGAGYNLMKLAIETANMGLTGLEWASGIPGEVGASTAMNAGAYNSSMADIVTKVKVLTPELEVKELSNEELAFEYRHSFFKDNRDYIIIEVELKLEKGNKEEILALIAKRKERRVSTQPLEYSSAGSVFRNPEGKHAGELIEKCGLKGYNINGIEVSEKHANFIINKDNGKGIDIVNLIKIVEKEVKEKYDIDLILEQEIVE